MKYVFEITALTKGFTLIVSSDNTSPESYVFESREILGAFLMDFFTKPAKVKTIRRKKNVQTDIEHHLN